MVRIPVNQKSKGEKYSYHAIWNCCIVGPRRWIEVLVLQKMKRKLSRSTKSSKHRWAEDNYKILELNVTSNEIPAFWTEIWLTIRAEGSTEL